MATGGFSVAIHSDHEHEAKAWCRKNLKQHQWLMKNYSDVYEHMFWFETNKDAQDFSNNNF